MGCSSRTYYIMGKLAILSVFTLNILFINACDTKLPNPPENDPFIIYSGGVQPGIDVGVDDSNNSHNWLIDNGDYLTLAYPEGFEYGSVFFTAGPVPLISVNENFSKYSSIQFQLRGHNIPQPIVISIEDKSLIPSTPQFIINPDTIWTTFTFPLSVFGSVDKSKLKNLIRFSFNGPCPNSFDVRDIRYLKAYHTKPKYFVLYTGGMFAPGFMVSDSLSSGTIDIIDNYCNYMSVEYPSWGQLGLVYIFSINKNDFSNFDTLSIDLKGDVGGEVVNIGISEILPKENGIGTHVQRKITSEWQSYSIQLSEFDDIDLKSIKVPFSLLLNGREKISFKFRNIIYH